MDHVRVVSFLVSVLLAIGAFHLLPPIAEQFFGILRRLLEQVASFLKWYRAWRRALWPAENSALVAPKRDSP